MIDYFSSLWPSFRDGVKTGFEAGQSLKQQIKDKLSGFMKDDNTIDGTNSNSPIRYDETGTNIYIDGDFINELNQQVKDTIYRLDGYYLIEPSLDSLSDYYLPWHNEIILPYSSSIREERLEEINNYFSKINGNICFNSDIYTHYAYLYVNYVPSTIGYLYQGIYGPRYIVFALEDGTKTYLLRRDDIFFQHGNYKLPEQITNTSLDIDDFNGSYYGIPLMIFYSESTYNNYINNGKSYTPNVTYVNGINISTNIFNSGDYNNYFNYDIGDTSVMTETEIFFSFEALNVL